MIALYEYGDITIFNRKIFSETNQLCIGFIGVIAMETNSAEPQNVTLDVMPLIAGYLPLPSVRLSKYIAANTKGNIVYNIEIILYWYYV